MATSTIIGIVSVVVLLLIVIVMYNSLIGKKNQVENVFGSIDALLQKRYDLIPGLVATVKQYAAHEESVLTEVTKLRSKILESTDTDNKVVLDNQLSATLGGLMVQVEQYPELKANENFIQLQKSLNEIEEQISAARRAYNATVTEYNNAIEMFPTNFIAIGLGYQRKQVFIAAPEHRENVDVKELFNS